MRTAGCGDSRASHHPEPRPGGRGYTATPSRPGYRRLRTRGPGMREPGGLASAVEGRGLRRKCVTLALPYVAPLGSETRSVAVETR